MITRHNHITIVAVQDEEAELLAELARIRKEREQEAAKKAAEAEKSRQQALQEEVIHGNPLYRQAQADFQVLHSCCCCCKAVTDTDTLACADNLSLAVGSILCQVPGVHVLYWLVVLGLQSCQHALVMPDCNACSMTRAVCHCLSRSKGDGTMMLSSRIRRGASLKHKSDSSMTQYAVIFIAGF